MSGSRLISSSGINGSYLGFAGEFKYLVSLTYEKLDVDPGLKEDIVIADHKKEKVAKVAKAQRESRKTDPGAKGIFDQKFQKTYQTIRKRAEKRTKRMAATTGSCGQDSIVIDSMANKRDTTYWQALRPIPLTKSEVSSYVLQDSIKVVKDSIRVKTKTRFLAFQAHSFATGQYVCIG